MKKLACLVLLALSGNAVAENLGDYAPAANICSKFTTFQPSTGAAFALAGTPALSVYKDNSTTQSTTGVTLTASFDSVTGLNHYCIDTSADGTFYSAGSNFNVVITTGTVDSVSVVGSVVGTFSLNKVAALRPATAGRTLVVDAAGLADANTVKLGPTGSGTAQTARDIGASVLLSSGTGTGQLSITSGVVSANATQWGGTAVASATVNANMTQISGDATAADNFEAVLDLIVGQSGSYAPFGIKASGTAQAYTAGTPSVTLASSENFGDNTLTGNTVWIRGSTQGYWQETSIASNVGSTDIATLAAALPVAATGTISYIIWGIPAATGGGSGLDAAGVRSAVGLTSANLDTQLAGLDTLLDTIAAYIDTEIATLLAGVNVEQMNGHDVCGTGDSGTPWTGCP